MITEGDHPGWSAWQMTRSQEVRLCLTETHSPAAQVKSQAGVPFSTGGVPLKYF